MKALLKSLAWSVATMILGMGIVCAAFFPKRTIWPVFPSGVANEPQFTLQVDRDFGWRTGDSIPISLFIKQPPSTEVDLNSIALAGDFERPSNYFEPIMRDTKSGARFICIKMHVQGLGIQPKWVLTGNLSYIVKGQADIKTANLPKLELHTSTTWDGRPDLQDGPLAVVQGPHWWYSGGSLLLGLAGMLACTVYLRRLAAIARGELVEELSPRKAARRDFVVVWRKIRSGDDSVDNYREMERIVRDLYRCETRTLEEVPLVLGDNHPDLQHVLTILGTCDRVLYQHAVLSDSEKKAVFDAFDCIFKLS